MTDADFLLRVLQDGLTHSRDAINDASLRIRGCQMTVHSRAADLRKRGLIIKCFTRKNPAGRVQSFYQLVGALKEASSASMAGGVSSSASSPAAPLAASGEGALTNGAVAESRSRADGHGDAGVTSGLPLTLFAAPRGAYDEDAA